MLTWQHARAEDRPASAPAARPPLICFAPAALSSRTPRHISRRDISPSSLGSAPAWTAARNHIVKVCHTDSGGILLLSGGRSLEGLNHQSLNPSITSTGVVLTTRNPAIVSLGPASLYIEPVDLQKVCQALTHDCRK
jgi:hypothetical protein